MTNEELLKEINSLPADAKRRVEDFITYVRQRYVKSEAVSVRKKKSFRDEPAFGMWKDREDMKNSVEWVRNIRKTHWKS